MWNNCVFHFHRDGKCSFLQGFFVLQNFLLQYLFLCTWPCSQPLIKWDHLSLYSTSYHSEWGTGSNRKSKTPIWIYKYSHWMLCPIPGEYCNCYRHNLYRCFSPISRFLKILDVLLLILVSFWISSCSSLPFVLLTTGSPSGWCPSSDASFPSI